jgi:hypothetical protein
MTGKIILISGIAAIAVFGAGTAIGWSATNDLHPATTPKTQTMSMHSAKDMRAHMQAMHPSLNKSQIDQLVADCQKNGGSSMMGNPMMHGTNMMGGTKATGGHASHHSGNPSSGMMSGGMMG